MSPLSYLQKSFCKEVSTIAYYDNAIFVFLCMEDALKPLDLGHDDCDGQACKDGRSRTWMILLYEDDPTHKAVLDGRLADLDWNYAGICHDKDEGVKLHHHVVVLFKNGRKNSDIASDLGIDKRFLRAWDRKKKAFRYLCHRDNSEKFQYSTDRIYGTIAESAVAACAKGDSLSEVQSIDEIVRLLDEIDGFVSYKFFLGLVNKNGLYPTFRRMGLLATRLLDEHNAIQRNKIDREISNVSKNEQFRRFLNLLHNMPFDDYVKLIDDKFGKDIDSLPPL